MNIKKATAERLLAVDALKKITGTCIYRGGRMPRDQQLKPPFVVVWLLSKERIYDHDGYSGLTEGVVQINCFAHDPDQADSMAKIVRQSLEVWHGEEGGAVDSVFLTDETEGFEKNFGIHFVLLDFGIAYHE